MSMSCCPCSSDKGDRTHGKNPLEDIVKHVIRGLDDKGRLSAEEIAAVWAGAVGEAAAKHSRPTTIKNQSIFVNVDGSAWLYELTLKKKEIVRSLEGKLKGKKIIDIRLRIGEIR